MIDIRCGALAQTRDGQRCQLHVGHEGSHACMFADSQGRAIATWDLDSDRHLVRQDSATAHEYPWAPTFPVAVGTVLTDEKQGAENPALAPAPAVAPAPAAATQSRSAHKRNGLRAVPSAQSVA